MHKQSLIKILNMLQPYRSLASVLSVFVQSEYANEDSLKIIQDYLVKIIQEFKKNNQIIIHSKEQQARQVSDKKQQEDIEKAEELLQGLLGGEVLEQQASPESFDLKKLQGKNDILRFVDELGSDLVKREQFGKQLEQDKESTKLVKVLLESVYRACILEKTYDQLNEQEKQLLVAYVNILGEEGLLKTQYGTVHFVLTPETYSKLQKDEIQLFIESIFTGSEESGFSDSISNLQTLGISIDKASSIKRNKFVSTIKKPADLGKITLSNISDYISLDGVNPQNNEYVLENIKQLFVYYLSYFEGYKSLLVNSDQLMTGASISKMQDWLKQYHIFGEQYDKALLKDEQIKKGNFSLFDKSGVFNKGAFWKLRGWYEKTLGNKEASYMSNYVNLLSGWELDSKLVQGFISITDSPSKHTQEELGFANQILVDMAGLCLYGSDYFPGTKSVSVPPRFHNVTFYDITLGDTTYKQLSVIDVQSGEFKKYRSFLHRFQSVNTAHREAEYEALVGGPLVKSALLQTDFYSATDFIQWNYDRVEEFKKGMLKFDEQNKQALKARDGDKMRATSSAGVGAPGYIASDILNNENARLSYVKKYITEINRKYVEVLLRSENPPSFVQQKRVIQSPLMAINPVPGLSVTLDFSKSDPDQIIRDSFIEFTGDSLNAIWDDIQQGRRESAFSNVGGMIGGIIGSMVVKNSYGFAVGQRLGAGVSGALGALVEGRRSETGDALGVGLGLMSYEFDEKNTIIDGIKYVDIQPTKTGVRRSFIAGKDNANGLSKGDFDLMAAGKIIADFGFDLLSVKAASKVSSGIGLDDMLTPLRNKLAARYGTKMAGAPIGVLKWGMDEMVVESFLVDIPLNVVQTGLYTFTGLDTSIKTGTLTTGTEKNIAANNTRKAFDFTDAFDAMTQAWDENTSAKNLADQVANTLVYGAFVELTQRSIHKIAEYLPSSAVGGLQESLIAYQEQAGAIASIGLVVERGQDGSLTLMNGQGQQLDQSAPEFTALSGVLGGLKQLAKKISEDIKNIKKQQEEMIKDPNNLKGRVLAGIAKFGLRSLSLPPTMILEKKISQLQKLIQDPATSEVKKEQLGSVLKEMQDLQADMIQKNIQGPDDEDDEEGDQSTIANSKAEIDDAELTGVDKKEVFDIENSLNVADVRLSSEQIIANMNSEIPDPSQIQNIIHELGIPYTLPNDSEALASDPLYQLIKAVHLSSNIYDLDKKGEIVLTKNGVPKLSRRSLEAKISLLQNGGEINGEVFPSLDGALRQLGVEIDSIKLKDLRKRLLQTGICGFSLGFLASVQLSNEVVKAIQNVNNPKIELPDIKSLISYLENNKPSSAYISDLPQTERSQVDYVWSTVDKLFKTVLKGNGLDAPLELSELHYLVMYGLKLIDNPGSVAGQLSMAGAMTIDALQKVPGIKTIIQIMNDRKTKEFESRYKALVLKNASLGVRDRKDAGMQIYKNKIGSDASKLASNWVGILELAIMEAHQVGRGEPGKDGERASVFNYTVGQLMEKMTILVKAGEKAGLTREVAVSCAKDLLFSGICGDSGGDTNADQGDANNEVSGGLGDSDIDGVMRDGEDINNISTGSRYGFSEDTQSQNSSNSDDLILLDENGEGVINPDAVNNLNTFLQSIEIRDKSGNPTGAYILENGVKLSDEQVRLIYEVHTMEIERNEGEDDADVEKRLNKRKALTLLKSGLFTPDQVRVLMEGKICGFVDMSTVKFVLRDLFKRFYKPKLLPRESNQPITDLPISYRKKYDDVVVVRGDLLEELKDHFAWTELKNQFDEKQGGMSCTIHSYINSLRWLGYDIGMTVEQVRNGVDAGYILEGHHNPSNVKDYFVQNIFESKLNIYSFANSSSQSNINKAIDMLNSSGALVISVRDAIRSGNEVMVENYHSVSIIKLEKGRYVLLNSIGPKAVLMGDADVKSLLNEKSVSMVTALQRKIIINKSRNDSVDTDNNQKTGHEVSLATPEMIFPYGILTLTLEPDSLKSPLFSGTLFADGVERQLVVSEDGTPILKSPKDGSEKVLSYDEITKNRMYIEGEMTAPSIIYDLATGKLSISNHTSNEVSMNMVDKLNTASVESVNAIPLATEVPNPSFLQEIKKIQNSFDASDYLIIEDMNAQYFDAERMKTYDYDVDYGKFLNRLVSGAKNDFLRKEFKKIASMAAENDVKIVFHQDYEKGSAYHPETKTLYVDTSFIYAHAKLLGEDPGKIFQETVLHELKRAYLYEFIEKDVEADSELKQLRVAYEKDRSIYVDVNQDADSLPRGLHNKHEMYAELANPHFVEFLKKVGYEGEKTMYDALLAREKVRMKQFASDRLNLGEHGKYELKANASISLPMDKNEQYNLTFTDGKKLFLHMAEHGFIIEAEDGGYFYLDKGKSIVLGNPVGGELERDPGTSAIAGKRLGFVDDEEMVMKKTITITYDIEGKLTLMDGVKTENASYASDGTTLITKEEPIKENEAVNRILLWYDDLFDEINTAESVKKVIDTEVKNGNLILRENGKIEEVLIDVGGQKKESLLFKNIKKSGYSEIQALKTRLQVRTPEFKNWFGDWQAGGGGVSKVVDAQGEPLVVFHGTDSDFSSFDFSKNSRDNIGWGANFTSSVSNARSFGSGEVIAAFLNIKHLYEFSGATRVFSGIPEGAAKVLAEKFKAKGFQVPEEYFRGEVDLIKFSDGVVNNLFDGNKKEGMEFLYNLGIEGFTGFLPGDSTNRVYSINSPSEIKSAVDASGNFSPNTDNIYN